VTIVPGGSGRLLIRGTTNYTGEAKPAISLATVDGVTTLRSVCRSPNNDCGYDYTVSLPPSVNAEVSTSAGDIAVFGSAARLTLRSASGDLVLDHVAGPLSASVGAGNVTGRSLSASTARVEDGSGNVALVFDAPPKEVTVRGSVGNVSVALPPAHPYHVVLSDGQGNISSAVADDPSSPDKIRLSESIGDVVLG
jgi:hypothetical protein